MHCIYVKLLVYIVDRIYFCSKKKVDRIFTHLDDKMTNNEAHIHYKIEKFIQIKYETPLLSTYNFDSVSNYTFVVNVILNFLFVIKN